MYCHHQYAHAADSPEERLHLIMKGADAAMETAALRFRLKIEIRPVYLMPEYDEECDNEYEYDNDDPSLLFGINATSDSHRVKGNRKWVGDTFRKVDLWDIYDCENMIPDNLGREDWVKPCSGIHWLNEPQHEEANLAFLRVSGSC